MQTANLRETKREFASRMIQVRGKLKGYAAAYISHLYS
jgi:hypothetical protein